MIITGGGGGGATPQGRVGGSTEAGRGEGGTRAPFIHYLPNIPSFCVRVASGFPERRCANGTCDGFLGPSHCLLGRV